MNNIKNWNNWPKWKKRRTVQIIVRCTLFTLMVSVLAIKLITGVGHAENLSEETAPVMYHSHYVTSGETLWDIASEHMSDDMDKRKAVYLIQKANDLDDASIHPGQRLKVPVS